MKNSTRIPLNKDLIEIVFGDITKVHADAIVNAANSSLMGGGGVDGAIHRAGGPSILEACRAIAAKQGHCKTGEAVITTAGNLKAKFVIHAVGPVWNGGNDQEEKLLSNAYRNSMQLAKANGCRSIAFPNISTGVYHFPKELAAGIAIKTVSGFLIENDGFDKVYFICYDKENEKFTKDELSKA
jgi:O-acetyl-ADP-ribose deacetylase (regulator of RNase III)